jgi:hypothetical protein
MSLPTVINQFVEPDATRGSNLADTWLGVCSKLLNIIDAG